jgi:hypothetical protein
MNAARCKLRQTGRKAFASAEAGKPGSMIMKPNTISELETVRVLHEDELDIVTGGAAPVWVSPMAIHGFNPQPDPPAVGLLPAV